MDKETNALIARWYLAQCHLGSISIQDFIDWAIVQLEKNSDSRNIGILAAFTIERPFYETEDYFVLSLKDLGWELPSKQISLKRYAADLASEILNEETPSPSGCEKIYKICQALNYPQELDNWILLHGKREPENYRQSIDWKIEEFNELELETAILQEARTLIDNETSFKNV